MPTLDAAGRRSGATRAWRRSPPIAPGLGAIERGALAARDGRIVFAGPKRDLPADWRDGARSDRLRRPLDHARLDRLPHPSRLCRRPRRANSSCGSPARATRRSRAQAAASSPPSRATRAASEDELVASAAAARRADRRRRDDGRDQVGLRARARRRAQDAARGAAARRERAGRGANDLPRRARAAAGIRRRPRRLSQRVVEKMLPALAAEGLVDAVDGFCETHRLQPRRDRARVRRGAGALRLPVKLHADQLSNGGGAALAAALRRAVGRSSRIHRRRRRRGDGEGRRRRDAAARRLLHAARDAGAAGRAVAPSTACAMAVATDCNPGTSPLTSLLLALNMAATLFRLTVEECLAGVTRNAARALGLGARDRHARSRANGPIWRSGTSSARPSSSIASASIRCTRASGGDDDGQPRSRARFRSPIGARSGAARRSRSTRRMRRRSAASAAAVARILARGEPVYGVNTGFGKLAERAHRRRRSRRAATQHRAVARRRGRRARRRSRRRG